MGLNNMKSIPFFLLLLCVFEMNAQPTLTLEEAIKTALENNYEIKIAGNNVKITETNISAGN